MVSEAPTTQGAVDLGSRVNNSNYYQNKGSGVSTYLLYSMRGLLSVAPLTNGPVELVSIRELDKPSCYLLPKAPNLEVGVHRAALLTKVG
jgi:hypothetical protein